MSKIIDIGKWKDALAEAASQDIVLAAMIKYKIPLTRKNYIQLAYWRGADLEEEDEDGNGGWGAELEAMLPEMFQKHDFDEE